MQQEYSALILVRRIRREQSQSDFLFALGVVTIAFVLIFATWIGERATYGNMKAFILAALLLPILPYLRRLPIRTLYRCPTEALVESTNFANSHNRKSIIAELCDRAASKDRMAKAYLYGLPWVDEIGGNGDNVRREPTSLIPLPFRLWERIVVYDPYRGFRTAKAGSRHARLLLVFTCVGLVILGEFMRDHHTVLYGPDRSKTSWLRTVGSMIRLTAIMIFPYLAFKSSGEDLDDISTRQAIFVFVHRRRGLRDCAAEVLRARAEDEPEAAVACKRLGL